MGKLKLISFGYCRLPLGAQGLGSFHIFHIKLSSFQSPARKSENVFSLKNCRVLMANKAIFREIKLKCFQFFN